MQMTDSQRIPASREAVWAALNDPAVLQRCIPGCETLEKASPTEMTATVAVKMGPVKARFSGKVTLSDLDPPNGYRIAGEGSGGVSGFAKGGATVRLEADGEATVLHYDVDAQIGGKLAQLGSRLIDSTARKLAGEFFENFAAAVAPPAEAEAAPTPEASDSGEAATGEEADEAGKDGAAKKGWLKGLFSKTAVLALLAGASVAQACCLPPLTPPSA